MIKAMVDDSHNLMIDYKLKEEKYIYELSLCELPRKGDEVVVNGEIFEVTNVCISRSNAYLKLAGPGRAEGWEKILEPPKEG